jgi:hypothetical protein
MIFFLIGFFGCISAYVIRERRQRSAFIARLLPPERERLRDFEAFNGDWRSFRDLFEPQSISDEQNPSII